MWSDKYKVETTEYDIAIKVAREQIAEIQLKHKKIKSKYDERQHEIGEYIKDQCILAEKKQYEEKQCKTAIRIQVCPLKCVSNINSCFISFLFYSHGGVALWFVNSLDHSDQRKKEKRERIRNKRSTYFHQCKFKLYLAILDQRIFYI